VTSRTTYETSVAGVGATWTSSVNAADLTLQESVNLTGVNAGANPQLGASSSQISSLKTAIAARLASRDAADRAKQATLAVARDTLRTAGDLAPL
jgi:hypothetical protein